MEMFMSFLIGEYSLKDRKKFPPSGSKFFPLKVDLIFENDSNIREADFLSAVVSILISINPCPAEYEGCSK